MGCTITQNAAQTIALGRALAAVLHGGETIAFTGGLGAGKTTFCKGLAQGLGVLDEVSSPTYTLVNYYRGPLPLAHFDAWRITSPEDLETAGYYDYLEAGAVVAIEWSEKIAPCLEPPIIRVAIGSLPDGSREICIEGADGF